VGGFTVAAEKLTMDQNQPIERISCVVYGRVQGVGFRAFAVSQARRLGITGWARNRNDGGSVEIVAGGPHDAIESFVRSLRSGPPSARATEVATVLLGGASEFDQFTVRQ